MERRSSRSRCDSISHLESRLVHLHEAQTALEEALRNRYLDRESSEFFAAAAKALVDAFRLRVDEMRQFCPRPDIEVLDQQVLKAGALLSRITEWASSYGAAKRLVRWGVKLMQVVSGAVRGMSRLLWQYKFELAAGIFAGLAAKTAYDSFGWDKVEHWSISGVLDSRDRNLFSNLMKDFGKALCPVVANRSFLFNVSAVLVVQALAAEHVKRKRDRWDMWNKYIIVADNAKKEKLSQAAMDDLDDAFESIHAHADGTSLALEQARGVMMIPLDAVGIIFKKIAQVPSLAMTIGPTICFYAIVLAAFQTIVCDVPAGMLGRGAAYLLKMLRDLVFSETPFMSSLANTVQLTGGVTKDLVDAIVSAFSSISRTLVKVNEQFTEPPAATGETQNDAADLASAIHIDPFAPGGEFNPRSGTRVEQEPSNPDLEQEESSVPAPDLEQEEPSLRETFETQASSLRAVFEANGLWLRWVAGSATVLASLSLLADMVGRPDFDRRMQELSEARAVGQESLKGPAAVDALLRVLDGAVASMPVYYGTADGASPRDVLHRALEVHHRQQRSGVPP